MKKNFFRAFFAVAAIATVGLGSYKAYGSYTAANVAENDLLLAEDVLAVSDPHESSWWDFFNNYYVEEWIPITSNNCIDGTVSYKGMKFSVSSCTSYTYAVYWHCYDGGKKDLCTSSGVHTYI